jgi:hypothetical protein
MRWSAEVIQETLSLYNKMRCSAAKWEIVADSLKLPCGRTLKRYSNDIEKGSGFNSEV